MPMLCSHQSSRCLKADQDDDIEVRRLGESGDDVFRNAIYTFREWLHATLSRKKLVCFEK